MQIYIILFENQAIMSNSTELKFGLCTFSRIPRNPGIEGHRKRNARLGWDEGLNSYRKRINLRHDSVLTKNERLVVTTVLLDNTTMCYL